MHSTTKAAVHMTLHCLAGCATGEILGMVLSAALNLSNAVTIIVSIALSFIFGYGFTLIPLVRNGMVFEQALRTSLAGDTVSITTMEIVDNLLELAIPGALAATLSTFLFWWSLALSLAVAFVVTVPVNRYLINHGEGHAHN